MKMKKQNRDKKVDRRKKRMIVTGLSYVILIQEVLRKGKK
jgi:hypothetical protein